MPSSDAPASGDSLEELYEDAPCGYLSLSPDGTILRANRTLLRSTGYTAEDLVGRRGLLDLFTRGSKLFHQTHWGPLLEVAGEVHEIPADLNRADGSRLPVLINAVLRRGAEGEPVAIRLSLFDATDRRRYERELVAARDQQAAVARLGARALEGTPPGVLLAKAADELRERSSADLVAVIERTEHGVRLAAQSGWPDRELKDGGARLAALHRPFVDGTDSARLREDHGLTDTLRVAVGGPGRSFGVIVLHSRSAHRFSPDDATFAESVANVLWMALERQRSDEATRHQALHDPLTGLPNRLLLDQRLVQEIERARRTGTQFALCLLDLDFFKLVNDSLGHLAGDALLCAVADRLLAAVRGVDMVGRLGGDEFVILCGDVERAGGAEIVAHRITAALAAPFSLEGVEHVVRASLGVVVGDGTSAPQALLRDADAAMYSAKDRGRGQHAHFDRSMRERARERLRVEGELRLALRRGDLRVDFQPVVTAHAGRIAGMEALVRWLHPERGLLLPAEFIAVAEESGLICDLGRFVLRQACRQLATWRAEKVLPERVGMAVNVSARQLAQRGFAADVAEALRGAGLARAPELLRLEITETAIMGSGDAPASVLDELAALGVGVVLDDFGTGASSLARLKRFPVDTLKVDRAFVAGLGDGRGEDDAIVAAVISMADALGLHVIAEGVETERQLARLQELGCRLIQGFLYAGALPVADMRALLVDEGLTNRPPGVARRFSARGASRAWRAGPPRLG